jgi:membrane protein DedA with SNARE-associated domain
VGGPILIAAGAVKIPIKDFLWYNFWATLPKSLAFLLIGFFFSHAIDKLNKYLGWTSLGLAILVALIILIYWLVYTKAKKIVKNL